MSRHDARPEISDELIGDYLDGRLEPGQEADLRARIEADPRLAARVAAYRAQDSGLKQLADSVLEEPVPDRLRRILEGPHKRNPRNTLNVHVAAAVLVGVALALATTALDARSDGDPVRPGTQSPQAMLGPAEA